MILDAFLVNREWDMLELRLLALDAVVDMFVPCYMDVTHAGDDQVLARPETEPRFARWAHKMQGLAVTDCPRLWLTRDEDPCPDCQHPWAKHTNTCWASDASGQCQCTTARPYERSVARGPGFQKRERHQRDAIARIRQDGRFQGDDLCFVSDVDEIWDPEALPRIVDALRTNTWVVCEQRFHGFALDYLHPVQPWLGTCVSYLADTAPQAMRDARGSELIAQVPDGGWHISWMGSPEEKQRKLTSFSHGELVDRGLSPQHCYENGKHSNGEMLQAIDYPGSLSWPMPLLDGSFVPPPSWFRPQR